MTALSAVHRIQAPTIVSAASRTGRTNKRSMLPGAGLTRSRPQVCASQAAPTIYKSASNKRSKARSKRARRNAAASSASWTANNRGMSFRPACQMIARITITPCVAADAAVTQAPLPSANSIVAATITATASPMNSQCQMDARHRRNGVHAMPVAARIARATGCRIAQYIATLYAVTAAPKAKAAPNTTS